MGCKMKEYKKIIENFIKDIKYMIPVIITAILGFGFVLTHSAVNVDSLAFNRYFYGQELLACGRFGGFLFNKIFDVLYFNPFFIDFLSVLFLILAAILFCALFKKVTKDKLKPIVYVIFSCFFISYPLISEIFVFNPSIITVCLSYSLIVIALMLFNEFSEKRNNLYFFYIILILCFTLSIYESFASLYLLGVFIIFVLKKLYGDKKYKFSTIFLDFIDSISPLFIAIIINAIISKIIFVFLDNPLTNLNGQIITYLNMGFVNGVINLFNDIIIKYIASAAVYLPITLFLIANIISFIFGIFFGISKKDFGLFVLFIGLNLTAISLSIVQGMAAPYRSCQAFVLFVSFIFMLLSQNILASSLKKFIKSFLIFIIFLLIFYQVKDLHKWFYVNYMRYEEEKNTTLLVCNEIEKNWGMNNSIIVIGEREFSDNIHKYLYLNPNSLKGGIYNKILSVFKIPYDKDAFIQTSQTNVNSYLGWAALAFNEPGVEIVKFMNLLGYNFKYASPEWYDEALEISEGLPLWPKDGSIVKTDNFVLVNL